MEEPVELGRSGPFRATFTPEGDGARIAAAFGQVWLEGPELDALLVALVARKMRQGGLNGG